MRRRHLRLPSSSDEDEPIPNPTPNPNPPLEISDDDDFVDVPDELSPPSPVPPQGVASPGGGGVTGESGRVDEFLLRLGLTIRREWLQSCLSALAGAVLGFESWDVPRKAEACFGEFLSSDMNQSGGGGLPENVHLMHKVELQGPFVLQVDEIVNISSPLRERYHDAPAGFKRCLKLSMTDGSQRVFGMEYRPIKELEILGPAGFKVVIHDVQVRRGLLMLTPEVFEFLGGLVKQLDAARKRLVDEVNKPPRGKRRQLVLPLRERASLVAWPLSAINNAAEANNSTSHSANNAQSRAQAATLMAEESDIRGRIVEEIDAVHIGQNVRDSAPSHTQGSTVGEFSGPHTSGHIVEEHVFGENNPDTEPNTIFSTVSDMEVVPQSGRHYVEEHVSADNNPHTEPNTAFRTVSDMEDVNVIDEAKHPLILSGDKEIPFTYLASLLAMWTQLKDSTPVVEGKIKCFLTGVKGFQFRQRSTFELHVFVDDGSLISEVLIDHHVVQKGIGYSTEEVTAALSSSDRETKANMREIMKGFQAFLAKFEGTIVIQISANLPLPLAIEMNHGCSTSDAWMLLRRLKMFTTPLSTQKHNFDSLVLSP